MRLSSFLIGAVAGAAAATYMNRGNKTMLMGFSQLGDSMSKIVDKAMISTADRNMKTHTETEANASLDKVQDLVNRDMTVKAEVDEILATNNVASTH